MSEALSYIYYFYDKLISFVFNDMEFFSGVTFGWVLIVVTVFMLMIGNIVNLPYKSKSLNITKSSKSNRGKKP